MNSHTRRPGSGNERAAVPPLLPALLPLAAVSRAGLFFVQAPDSGDNSELEVSDACARTNRVATPRRHLLWAARTQPFRTRRKERSAARPPLSRHRTPTHNNRHRMEVAARRPTALAPPTLFGA